MECANCGHSGTKTQHVCGVQVVAIGSALLKRLRLYAATAKTSEVAEQLVKGHMSSGPQLATQQVSKLFNTLSSQLVDLSEELITSEQPTPVSASTAALAQKQGECLMTQQPTAHFEGVVRAAMMRSWRLPPKQRIISTVVKLVPSHMPFAALYISHLLSAAELIRAIC